VPEEAGAGVQKASGNLADSEGVGDPWDKGECGVGNNQSPLHDLVSRSPRILGQRRLPPDGSALEKDGEENE
tara:strand:+ start:411 stop:626 length:216 start_codon:yes stop_codon:yes gene_type:complete